MQAEDSPRAVPSERSGLKPTTAFFILLSGAALVAAIVYLTRPAPPTPTGTATAKTAPNFALTDEEAIATFEELHASLLDAYRTRDVSLLDAFLTSESPLRRRATSEIQQLLDDRVVARPVFASRSIRVEENGPSRIIVRQVVIDSSRFESESGDGVTQDPKRILRVVRWTMELEVSIWKIHDSDPLRSKTL